MIAALTEMIYAMAANVVNPARSSVYMTENVEGQAASVWALGLPSDAK